MSDYDQYDPDSEVYDEIHGTRDVVIVPLSVAKIHIDNYTLNIEGLGRCEVTMKGTEWTALINYINKHIYETSPDVEWTFSLKAPKNAS